MRRAAPESQQCPIDTTKESDTGRPRNGVSVCHDDHSISVGGSVSGVELRLWHDQILIKQPGVSKATEFHQDQPYWPHAHSPYPISCWIALGDVPSERGCMTFIPRQHHRSELRMQNLADSRSLFEIAPDRKGWAAAIMRTWPSGEMDRLPLSGLNAQSNTAKCFSSR